jgi:hypothetical protein
VVKDPEVRHAFAQALGRDPVETGVTVGRAMPKPCLAIDCMAAVLSTRCLIRASGKAPVISMRL